jgi:hypothetical protein
VKTFLGLILSALISVVVLIAALALGGCGSSSPPNYPAPCPPPTTTTVTVTTITVGSVCSQVGQATCARFEQCGFGTQGECLEVFLPSCCSGLMCGRAVVAGYPADACAGAAAGQDCAVLATGVLPPVCGTP